MSGVKLMSWFLAKFPRAAPTGRALSVEAWVRVGTHHTASILRAGGQSWVVVCHPGGATVVGELERASLAQEGVPK